ncbi:RICIN domain-containing protein [Mycolicibacterium stellerae]|uniref:RICIN domain-containing protein n=1 Tax=Mycolicibacterium stellerae TaxID=2358193 RepID=UPI000F0B0D87|nr:RICIN domain-containing protein [Mycolicibacterium stellerae]
MSITTNEEAVATRVVRLQGGGLRFLDAHQTAQKDCQVFTRAFQGSDASQHWRVTELGGGVSTIQQVSSGRFLDAHEIGDLDFRVVTRPRQDSDTQRWRIQDFGGGFISIEQVSSGRFLEATLGGDFTVVTRPAISSEQTWRIGDP